MPKSFIGEHFCAVFQKTSGSENFYGQQGGGGVVSGFSVEKILSHSAEKFFKGTFLCFTKLPLSKNVKEKRGCDSSLSVEKFCLTGQKKFIEEPFCDVF